MTKQQAIEGSPEALREYMRAYDEATRHPDKNEIPADVAAFLTEEETTSFMVTIAVLRQLDVALVSGKVVPYFVGEPTISTDLQQVIWQTCLDGSTMTYSGDTQSQIFLYSTVTYQADYVAPGWKFTQSDNERAESC